MNQFAHVQQTGGKSPREDECCSAGSHRGRSCPPNWNNRRPADEGRSPVWILRINQQIINGSVQVDKEEAYRVLVCFDLCRRQLGTAVGTLLLIWAKTVKKLKVDFVLDQDIPTRRNYLRVGTASFDEVISKLPVPQRHKRVLKE